MESGAQALGSVQAAPSAQLESREHTCSLCLEGLLSTEYVILRVSSRAWV